MRSMAPIHDAAEAGDSARLSSLLNDGADPNTKDRWCKTALMWASRKGHRECMELLITKGADLNEKDEDGTTALMWASRKGHRECMALLITKGVDLNEKNNDGNTALMVASKNGKRECMEELIPKGASLDEKNNAGMTALMEASDKGHRECLELLISKGADLNEKDNDGNTALATAIIRGHRECRQLLIDAILLEENEENREVLTSGILRAQLGHAEAKLAAERRALEEERRVRLNLQVKLSEAEEEYRVQLSELGEALAAERRARAEELSAWAAERETWGINTCTVCQDRVVETRFLDCTHACACEQCTAELRERGASCPLCRSAIRDVRSLRADIREAEPSVPVRLLTDTARAPVRGSARAAGLDLHSDEEAVAPTLVRDSANVYSWRPLLEGAGRPP